MGYSQYPTPIPDLILRETSSIFSAWCLICYGKMGTVPVYHKFKSLSPLPLTANYQSRYFTPNIRFTPSPKTQKTKQINLIASDATDIIAIRLIVAVHVAVVKEHVPRKGSTCHVGSRRPIVVRSGVHKRRIYGRG